MTLGELLASYRSAVGGGRYPVHGHRLGGLAARPHQLGNPLMRHAQEHAGITNGEALRHQSLRRAARQLCGGILCMRSL